MEVTRLAWTPEQLAKFDAYWLNRSGGRATQLTRILGKGVCKFLEHTGSLAGCRVLHYAAGSGHLVEQLLQRGAEVEAFDVSQRVADELNQRFRRDRFWRGAVCPGADGVEPRQALPWADASFDVIICLDVLPRLADGPLKLLMRQFQRLLRSEGRLLLTSPLAEALREDTVFCPQCACEYHRWQHVRSWTQASLTQHLQALGLDVAFCEPMNFAAFQSRPPHPRDVLRPAQLAFYSRELVAALFDHLQPRPFPRGRLLQRRLHHLGPTTLTAIVGKAAAAASEAPQQSAHPGQSRQGQAA